MTVTSAKQDWDPSRYARDAAFVSELGRDVLSWLEPRTGERILDLGCGDGRLTAEIAALGVDVIGVDTSPAQIAAARARGLDARVMAGEALGFVKEFDAVFSNAALHWMLEPDAVIAAVSRALRSGGRFVAEMGGAGNIAEILAALHAELEVRGIDGRSATPWYFPTPEAYGDKLVFNGFEVRRFAHFPRPVEMRSGMISWLQIFAGSFSRLLPEAERASFHAAVAARLEPALYDRRRDVWRTDYVRLRFAAVKP